MLKYEKRGKLDKNIKDQDETHLTVFPRASKAGLQSPIYVNTINIKLLN